MVCDFTLNLVFKDKTKLKLMANDYFQFKQFIIYQDRCAFKVGTDGVILGACANKKEPAGYSISGRAPVLSP
jgi:tRNA1(Val) A37 N6-methylase TrmN6